MNKSHITRIYLALSTVIILVSVAVHYTEISEHGLILSPDSRTYLRASIALYNGEGLSIPRYNPTIDAVQPNPLAHYPPMTSVLYGLPTLFGLTHIPASAVTMIVCWALLLITMGLLAYRLSGSMPVVAATIALATLTTPFYRVYSGVWSEPMFLPLLVLTAWLFTDLPQAQKHVLSRLAVGALLLSLLMLTRYVGIFFYGTLVLWWIAWRLWQRQPRHLIYEVPILGLAAIPFALWVARNMVLTGEAFGPHLEESSYGFVNGMISAVFQTFYLFIPAFNRFQPYIRMIYLAIPVLISVGVIGFLLFRWYQRAPSTKQHEVRQHSWRLLVRTPIIAFVLVYFTLYTLAQPFFNFHPMDARDMTSLLSLLQPWLLAALVVLPAAYLRGVLAGYLGVNLLFLVAFVAYNPQALQVRHWPPRTQTLLLYHQDLSQWLQSREPEPIITTNTPLLFAPHPEMNANHGWAMTSIPQWVEQGTCTPDPPTVIVLTDRDALLEDESVNALLEDELIEDLPTNVETVERKCPGLEPIRFKDSIVYELGQEE